MTPVNEAQKKGATMKDTATALVTLGTEHFSEANELVRKALAASDVVEIRKAFAQRYLGCALPQGKKLEIHGVPGNDLACYLNGGTVEVFGNAQDQVGNTMNDGCIVVHGGCGDAAGYGMRGGRMFVRDNCGWRVGIHMKQFEDKRPSLVIGGDAGSFLGEYLAGGVIVLLGRPGAYLATGMHGGVIYLRHPVPDDEVLPGLVQEPVDATDRAALADLLAAYNRHFADELDAPAESTGEGFFRIRPASSRPYAELYAS